MFIAKYSKSSKCPSPWGVPRISTFKIGPIVCLGQGRSSFFLHPKDIDLGLYILYFNIQITDHFSNVRIRNVIEDGKRVDVFCYLEVGRLFLASSLRPSQ